MRWFWIDRFTEFVSGQRATALKSVSLSEDHLHDHFPGAPVMPNSLIIEGIAQAGGILLIEGSGFRRQVVLAKVGKAKFHFEAAVGETLTYRVHVEDARDDGGIVSATSHVGDRLQAEVELVFVAFNLNGQPTGLYDPEAFLVWMRMLRLYDVGVDARGTPLVEPTAVPT